MAEENEPNEDPNAEGEPNADPNEPDNAEGEGDVEQRARQHGWVPKEEFRGPDDRWIDAETFMERADNELPIARERMKKLEERNASLETTIKEFIREQRSKDKQQHERSVAQIKRDREKALDDGDTDTVKRLDQELEQVQKSAPPEPEKDTQTGWTPEFKAAVDRFQEQNGDWYGKDALRTKEFADYHDFLLQNSPEMGDEDRLEAARKAVFEKYPRAGGNRRKGGSPVEGGGSSQRKGGSKKKGYDDLPPEAKQAYDNFVTKQKVMKGEEYLREYFGEEYEG